MSEAARRSATVRETSTSFGAGVCGHALADVHGDTGYVGVVKFDFAAAQTGADPVALTTTTRQTAVLLPPGPRNDLGATRHALHRLISLGLLAGARGDVCRVGVGGEGRDGITCSWTLTATRAPCRNLRICATLARQTAPPVGRIRDLGQGSLRTGIADPPPPWCLRRVGIDASASTRGHRRVVGTPSAGAQFSDEDAPAGRALVVVARLDRHRDGVEVHR